MTKIEQLYEWIKNELCRFRNYEDMVEFFNVKEDKKSQTLRLYTNTRSYCRW